MKCLGERYDHPEPVPLQPQTPTKIGCRYGRIVDKESDTDMGEKLKQVIKGHDEGPEEPLF